MKSIPDFPDYYAGEDGHIYSAKRRRLHQMTEGKDKFRRYLSVSLRNGGPKTVRCVHTLVCIAWHGERPAGKEVSHLNGDKYDNRPLNLAWETKLENAARRDYSRKLTIEQVREIRERLQRGDESGAKIALDYGVKKGAINAIRRNEVWRGRR